jgi:uncharacterized caspase-like protein
MQSAVGTMIAYATQPDNVAQDGAGQRNSPFAAAVLKHIETPGLEISAMMKQVRADVVAATKEAHVPWDHSSLLGDVMLVPAAPAVAAGNPAGSSLAGSDPAERGWASIKES